MLDLGASAGLGEGEHIGSVLHRVDRRTCDEASQHELGIVDPITSNSSMNLD